MNGADEDGSATGDQRPEARPHEACLVQQQPGDNDRVDDQAHGERVDLAGQWPTDRVVADDVVDVVCKRQGRCEIGQPVQDFCDAFCPSPELIGIELIGIAIRRGAQPCAVPYTSYGRAIEVNCCSTPPANDMPQALMQATVAAGPSVQVPATESGLSAGEVRLPRHQCAAERSAIVRQTVGSAGCGPITSCRQ